MQVAILLPWLILVQVCVFLLMMRGDVRDAFDFDVAMMTRPRPSDYACATVRNVGDVLNPPSLVVFHFDARDVEEHCGARLWRAATHVRAEGGDVIRSYAQVVARFVGSRALLVLEDDVLLERRFRQSLDLVLAEAHVLFGGEFIMSLYHGTCCGTVQQMRELVANSTVTPRLAVAPSWQGWGTQAMFFSGARLIADLAEEFNRTTTFVGLQDTFLDAFARRRGYAICGVTRSLVQHVGEQSSLFGNNNTRFHASLTFSDTY